jgi:hypothetical protein
MRETLSAPVDSNQGSRPTRAGRGDAEITSAVISRERAIRWQKQVVEPLRAEMRSDRRNEWSLE